MFLPMKNSSGIAQLFLRLALGVGFILPVMDRLGLMGPLGSPNVSWGDWKHFVVYAHTLMPFLNHFMTNIMAAIATASEATFGICLIIGFKIKQVSLGAAILTFIFGLCMAVFIGISAPFNYPVFVFTGAGLVLSGIGYYKWSIDEYLVKT
jgi:uncharacterized membrane protein YphA (DoxX/SURF4 family)